MAILTTVTEANPMSQSEPPVSPGIKSAAWLYPATTFLSAALLFTLQPLFAKMLTPLMGGTPAVWNTALVFYQGALLIGYLYAHLIATRLKPRTQLVVHAATLVLGLCFLPVHVTTLLGQANVDHPVLWTLGALFLSLGFPIIAISATAPLIQAWRARLGDAVDPYRLYAASNLGSFSALAAFPFLIEPLIGAKVQAVLWTIGYIVLAVALVTAIWLVPKDSQAPTEIATSKTSWKERLVWIAFAAPPSALLVAVTTHLTTDVASVPLLWVIPLALFLLTFVIAFSALGDKLYSGAAPLKFMVVFLLAALMAADLENGIMGLFIHLAAFFLIVVCCHIELAGRRPEPARLTEFYLWMSLGGVLGGAAAALLAPVIFNTTIEYQLALAAAVCVAQWHRADLRSTLIAAALVILAASVYQYNFEIAGWLEEHFHIGKPADVSSTEFWYSLLLVYEPGKSGAVLCAALAIAAMISARSALFSGLIVGVALLVPVLAQDGEGIKFRERSFFGVLEIEDIGDPPTGFRHLAHGTTLHGMMSLDPVRNREPLSYYYRETPIGLLFAEATATKPETLHAGVIGMGMGSSTCYAKSKQNWKVFEIDRDVVRAATDPNLVGFINRCAPQAEIIMGDARLSMQKQPDNWFDILLVDAFSSDAIPTHMITKEAISSFMKKITTDGIMVVHISNRYLSLEDIVTDAAHELGYVAVVGTRDGVESNEADTGVTVVVISKTLARVERYRAPIWELRVPSKDPQPWTDDHTDILRALFPPARP